MRLTNHYFSGRVVLGTAIVLLGLTTAIFGQSAPVRPHVHLPSSYGATPISAQINAQASYMAAAGDFLEGAANARLTNSLAAKKEMENSVLWVSTYFERKEINRRYTQQPTYLDRQRANKLITRGLVESDFQVELKGDVSDKLNWMLQELNSLSQAQCFIPGGQDSLVDAPIDTKLSRDDIHHILLTDGGRANGQLLLFRADAAEALDTRWPRALRDPGLDRERQLFEWARDESLEELKSTGELSHEGAKQLMARVDSLCTAFNALYHKKRRLESAATYMSYLAGKKYLQSLALGVHRVIQTEDQRALDGSYRFQGDSVADLIGHMHRFGIEFGPATQGDEGVYRKLFYAMRQFYMRLSAENS